MPLDRPEVEGSEEAESRRGGGPGHLDPAPWGPLAAHCVLEPWAQRAASGTQCNAETVRGVGRRGAGDAGEGGGKVAFATIREPNPAEREPSQSGKWSGGQAGMRPQDTSCAHSSEALVSMGKEGN